jgi:hypothetical protein
MSHDKAMIAPPYIYVGGPVLSLPKLKIPAYPAEAPVSLGLLVSERPG